MLKSELHVVATLQLRAALWATGHVGSSDLGFELLHEANLLPKLVELAMDSACLSLRGTMMCVLSLVGQSPAGRSALQQLKWDTSSGEGYVGRDGAAYSVCLSYPLNYRQWVYIAPSKRYHLLARPFSNTPKKPRTPQRKGGRAKRGGSDPTPVSPSPAQPELDEETKAQQDLLKVVRQLANPVLYDQSSKELKRLKQKSPTLFQQPQLTTEVHRLVNTYRYRPQSRKLLYEYFDGPVAAPDFLAELDRVA
eukprot:TRINITY_DN29153_c0_g1_i1.p1 TRINITY_DN29153_c0_g1~~TRINITY_DN29153_c0_g1_i1.p1  ORF type:complete len:251 (-),score=56.11 TRINITY_DN29153_c0_g1_i1:39-791(-)